MSDDPTNDAFLQTQLTATEAAIVATQAAILTVVSGAQSYTLDTGQTRQTVTRSTLGDLRLALKALYDIRVALRNQLGLTNNVGRQVHVIPGF